MRLVLPNRIIPNPSLDAQMQADADALAKRKAANEAGVAELRDNLALFAQRERAEREAQRLREATAYENDPRKRAELEHQRRFGRSAYDMPDAEFRDEMMRRFGVRL